MAQSTGTQSVKWMRLGAAFAAGLLLAACNLGPQAASGPPTATPQLVVPQGAGDQLVQVTETPLISDPADQHPRSGAAAS